MKKVCERDSKEAPLVILATHNESSVVTTVDAMEKMSIGKKEKVHFAQIRGMGDQVGFNVHVMSTSCN